MRDPFRPNTNAQLFREAQAGLVVIAILLILFVYVAYYRISGVGRTVPESVRLAPVAESVWPQYSAPSPEPELPIQNHLAVSKISEANPDQSFNFPPKLASTFSPQRGEPDQTPKSPPTKPVVNEPFKSEPFKSEPFESEPFKSEPFKSEPFKSEPFVAESSLANKPLNINPSQSSANVEGNLPIDDPFQSQQFPTEKFPIEQFPTEQLLTRTEMVTVLAQENKQSLEAAPNSAQRQEAIDNSLHVVCEGDSFWSIAQACYGDGQFFRALYEHNRDQVTDFDRLKSGQCIKTPPSDKLQKDYPELCPYEVNHQIRLVSGFEEIQESANENEATHSTSAGDTLFEIAKQRLGQASRYLEILDLNADTLPLDVDHQTPLPSGLKLKLP